MLKFPIWSFGLLVTMYGSDCSITLQSIELEANNPVSCDSQSGMCEIAVYHPHPIFRSETHDLVCSGVLFSVRIEYGGSKPTDNLASIRVNGVPVATDETEKIVRAIPEQFEFEFEELGRCGESSERLAMGRMLLADRRADTTPRRLYFWISSDRRISDITID